MIQASDKLSERWDVYSRYFYECKPVRANGEFTKIIRDQARQKLRLQMDGALRDRLLLKSRLEFTWYGYEQGSVGWMVFQDIGYQSS